MAAENTAFSSSGEEVIHASIEISDAELPDSVDDLDSYFDIPWTADEIIAGGWKRTALQFPDELLRYSVPIYRSLMSRLGPGRELYVLADTSYGSCCVDEVAAKHADVDAVVHYGHACMSQTYRLPVIYVFGKKQIDVDDCVAKFVAQCRVEDLKRPVVLRHDVGYTQQIPRILSKLRAQLDDLEVLCEETPTRIDPSSSSEPRHRTAAENATILYVGGESLSLTNLLMTHSTCDVYSYLPKSREIRLESGKTNRMLMRRYAAVQKARDADVFGILVGTLGVASYLPLIKHLRETLKKAQKKSYTISVGKLNPAKLANFMEIECFVLVACPENSVIEAKEFLRPIVTPFELQIALQAEPDWTGRYVLDFEQLLAESKAAGEAPGTTNGTHTQEDAERPHFSLVTGKYKQARRFGVEEDTTDTTDGSSAVARSAGNALARLADSAALQHLQSRSYQGLEQRLGEDAPSLLEQGRSGIARGYSEI
ncbi:diphthamide biosynthesis protein [Schizophyllum commune H4-8]|uniref:diphthamide biosynthesis protein n=1 Tax=Schizophyllum commune (strain H4-8 / FGSC 9210) TaxID=578458 RepID=UPI00216067F9|nr:diphthamide biosynthesis protein [Schizophyllum commune H4-8]KAI5891539.1 diphthamide biosynthesis protein [Schizophyllum commune H4-8]